MYRRKCLFLVLVDSLALSAFLLALNHILSKGHFTMKKKEESFVDSSQFLESTLLSQQRSRTMRNADPMDYQHCTMEACFDFSRCRGPHGFKVYVYPDPEEDSRLLSPLFQEILVTITSSPYVTTNPEEACLFIPSWDTLDRDKHSNDFESNLPSLASLPYWNGGRNHLIFVQYSGTWPDYSEVLDFPTGQAILARASMNIRVYRNGFDISLPLMHKEHPGMSGRHSGLLSVASLPGFLPARRKYLLVFKGKRYLYGQGSRIRSSLYHLHNGRDIILLTTCKHNQDWVKYTDDRCDMDNVLYDRYDYEDLMANSSFCLVPRGRRLGSFRFLEALQASCIPVSLSNGYVLPFAEVLDWSKAALLIDEKQLLQLPYILRGISSAKVLSLRLYTQFMWDTYFSSVSKIVTTTLEIIRSRLEPQPLSMWNSPPGHLQIHEDFSPSPLDYPFSDSSFHHYSHPFSSIQLVTTPHHFTAVIVVTRPALRDSSPLLRLLQVLGQSPRLGEVVLVWAGLGPPQVMTSKFNLPVLITKVEVDGHQTRSLWPGPHINTSAVLHLYQDSSIITEEIEFGFSTWQAFPSRLVGYHSHTHSWDDVRQQWAYSSQPRNHVSMVSTDALFYHKYYGYIMTNFLEPTLKKLADLSPACLTVIFNCVVSQSSLSPPIKLPHNRQPAPMADSDSSKAHHRVACLNMAVNAFGYMPLLHSRVRLDPVLYRDNVSVYRKEYRRMELG